jgi:uncharacterized protein YxjI
MGTSDGFEGIEFTDERYQVEHSLVSNSYHVCDTDGDVLLEADERSFNHRGELPFRDEAGDEVFRLEPGNVDNDYFVVPADSDSPRVIVEEDLSFLQHRWNIRRGTDERLVAIVEAAGPSVEFFRYYVPMMGVLPHTYTIEDADGTRVGALSRQFGLAEKYVLSVDPVDGLPRETLVAAAISVDILDSR